MIIEIKHLLPGQMEKYSDNYKNKKHRTVFFLEDYVTAQFFETNHSLTTGWKKHNSKTCSFPETFCAMNLSLEDMRYVVVYHDCETVSLDDIKREIPTCLTT